MALVHYLLVVCLQTGAYDLNGGELVLDADADTSIDAADTDDTDRY